MALTKIDDRGVTYPLDLLDSEKIRFGTGNDLEVYHTSGVNYIQTHGNTNLEIKHGSDVGIKSVADGSVEIYNDGTKKLHTYGSGINVSGRIAFTDASLTSVIDIPDGKQLVLGDSGDLSIYHDGNSRIKSTSGALKLLSDATEISNAANNEAMAVFTANGSCELYYDNVKTIETAANGYVHLTGSNDLRLTLGSQGTEGTNDANWIRGEGVNLMFNSASGNHTWEVGGSEKLRLQSGGGISFNGDNQAANALDDYEYGTFTPTWNTDSASVTIGYHTQKGFYVKIGRMVYFQVYIRLNSSGAVSGGSGALAVHGLPFTPQNATSSDNVAYGTANIGYTNSWSGDTADRALVSSGSAKFYVYVGQSSGTNVVAGAGNLGNDTQFRASGSYVAA